MRFSSGLIWASLLGVGACTADEHPEAERLAAAVPAAPSAERQAIAATVAWRDSPAMTAEELERGRFDAEWRQVVELDSVPGAAGPRNPEKWESIVAEGVNEGTMFVPLYGDVSGPSVLRAQVLLDRALFSPGIMDGRWERTPKRRFTGYKAGKACAAREGWTRKHSPESRNWQETRNRSFGRSRSLRRM